MGAPPTLQRLTPAPGTRLVVVGGCGAIGRAVVATALANEVEVMVMDMQSSIDEYPPPDGVEVLTVDATNEREVKTAFDFVNARWRRLDGLINLAGFLPSYDSVEASDPAQWQAMVDGSLTTTYLSCRSGAPLLRKGQDPSIVNMSSGLAYRGRQGHAPYAAAKAGVVALTRTLAAELAPVVRVNAVAPGAVKTAFLSGGTGRGGHDADPPLNIDVEQYAARLPLGRLGEPMDIAEPILFLCSEAARYITGQVMHINGGGYMR